MKLYEINPAILACIDEETGEVIDVEQLVNLKMEQTDKADNIGCLFKGLMSEVDAIKHEIEILEARHKSKKKQAEYWKSYLAESLSGAPIETARVKISFRPSESVDVVDMSVIDEIFVRVKEIREVDKTAIKEAIKSGVTVVGAELVTKNNIQIK